ncbi:MAG: hypothetical protein NTV34_05545 [Proteobacteria bacterium]|nr:hypothetical protein [Pseudomonadota bacterium]
MALKLLEIGAVDSSLARIFFSQFMHRLRFFLVNKELVDAWASSSVIDARDRVQLAVRRNQEVRINKQLFEQLTPSNKTGLLINEAVTHFSYPSEANYEDQRRAVARLFMSELRNNGGELLTEVTGSLDNASRKLPTFGITIFNGEEAAALIKMTLNGRQVILSYTEDAQVSAKRLCGNWTSGTSVVIIGGKNLTIRVWHDFDLENSFLIYQTSTWMPPLYQYTINGNQCQTEIVNTILHVREELRAQDFWAPNK